MSKKSIADKILKIEESLNNYYFERSEAIRGISVAILSNLNIVLVGPPGTAKTDISKSWTSHITNGDYFGTTVNKHTTPDEIFGAVDMLRFKNEGILSRKTKGYLPSANIVAIEEIFKAGKGTLNALIEVAHSSRLFSNGPEQVKTPILAMICTSNELPVNDLELMAIYDRMTIKNYVHLINSPDNFANMTKNSQDYDASNIEITIEDILAAREEVKNVEVDEGIITRIRILREELFKKGIYPSDRTFKLSIKALKAQAYLSGRTKVEDDDIMFLRHMLWHAPDESSIVYMMILEMIKPEIKGLGQMLQSVQSSVEKSLKEENANDMMAIYKKIGGYIDEAKQVRSTMLKKNRNITECDEIINTLKYHASRLSKQLIGVDVYKQKQDNIY